MYPRNAASPERILIGQVVLITDGTTQPSGVAITVRGQGGPEASGVGTIAYGADNSVYYTPTQAETNFTSFVIIASKALCFSASQTIITTASSTSGNVVLSPQVHTSAVIPTVSVLTGHTPQTADHTTAIANIPTTSEFNARTIPSADYFDPSNDIVANVALVATTTTNTDMVAEAPTVSDILTTQMTESYAADGVAPTLAEALFINMQNLGDFSFSGTTQTVKKLDGSATAATYTLDNAVTPTSKTRAT